MEKYLEMKQRHQTEINAFPFFFAFSEKAFNDGMARLGLDAERDTGKIMKFGSTGGFFRKEDEPRLDELFKRQSRERAEAFAADTTGEGFIFQAWRYELAEHEYCYTNDTEPALAALGLTWDDLDRNPALDRGFELAINEVWREP